MAPGSARRRRLSEAMDEDSDSGPDSPSQASDSPKRQRLNHDHDHDTKNGDAGAANKDGFHPGAIVRVSVENFVTYEKADFFPGPNLNMVIGPNGTGKSSLVCAICLGLGYSPKHLGRAGSVKEFVKHGKDTATIEIELAKRPQDRSNYVIRVQIRREQNSQKWWLNGKETTHKKIQSLMRIFKIQVDNLCQFLPQDRVVEFAACTPVDLLRETLRAAAPEEMIEWQERLRELHKEKKELVEDVHGHTETLQNLENRQQGLQADVDRIREREEIQERVEDLKGALVICRYEDARRRNAEAKERKRSEEEALRKLQDEHGPSLQAVNHKQAYVQQIEAYIPTRERAVREAEMKVSSLATNINSVSDDIGEIENNLAAERNGFESKKKNLALCRSKITGFQADLKSRPAEFNAADWNQRIRAEEHQVRELVAEERQISEQRDTIRGEARKINQAIQVIKDDLESLNTQQGQQLNLLRTHFPDAAKAWEWVQGHMDDFEKPVFGPPMITCSIKDERYSDQVQSQLQTDEFTCFTAQTKGDYKKLSDQLYRQLSLSVVVRMCAQPLESFRPPLSREEAEALGLDGFAIDYLEGPAPVLAMLCAERRLHQAGVSLSDHSDSQYERLVNSNKVTTWAAGKQSYMVRRRKEYGPQAMTTITKNIQPGRFWTTQGVDEHVQGELKRKLEEKATEKSALRDQHTAVEEKLNSLKEQQRELDTKIDQLKAEKAALQKEHQKWQSLPGKIEAEERSKALHQQAMNEARQKITDLGYEWDAAVVRRSKLAIKLAEAIDGIEKARHELLQAKLWLIEAKSDVAGLTDRSADIVERLELAKQSVQEAAEEARATRAEGKQLTDEVRDLLVGNEEKKDLYNELQNGKSPEDVRIEMEAEAAKLELIHAANPNVLREFEKRAQEITRLKRKMETSNEKLGELTQQLEDVMGRFEPKLDDLVSKINDAFAYNFEQISCAGEVRVHKDEDFEQWALDIMVKFRENETLQQLTAHRQSGGERAVSTIFYLMALQSMAQSPFRVVDEINQGMDPRNERMVHERMVEIACREHTSQYFLITPKLLTGLRYDAKMRVLCIASGEHMPREGKKLDFRRCLRVQKRLMAEA